MSAIMRSKLEDAALQPDTVPAELLALSGVTAEVSMDAWDGAVASYRKQGWVLVQGFAADADLETFRREVFGAPSRRVTVGDSGEQWTEHAMDRSLALVAFLTGPRIGGLAEACNGAPLAHPPAVWAQSYRAGERIGWHRDDAGDIQALLCIDAPAEAFGGVFCMRIGGKETRLALKPRDALFFPASRIAHSTTRLVAGPGCETPCRITAVSRFFAR